MKTKTWNQFHLRQCLNETILINVTAFIKLISNIAVYFLRYKSTSLIFMEFLELHWYIRFNYDNSIIKYLAY